jgi:hypothetical protein
MRAVDNNAEMSSHSHSGMPQQRYLSPMSNIESEMLVDRRDFWWDQSYESLEPNVQLFDPQPYYSAGDP